ncbi:substance-K receptor-like [Euwallacea fornicatus]|uniref:substance-K receptor-like n=1 Tax=Euwallacea fornicatus TaxID=995702 RepID=UPI00338E93C8
MGLKSSKERVKVSESFLIGFEVNRALYFWIILVISVLAVIGNLLAVRTVILSKYKYLQKTCIISLAISDLLTVIIFSMNNLYLLYYKPMEWIYGEFLCHFMPIGQVLGNLTNSIALLAIALDRYHNVIHALSPKWNPSLGKCIGGTLFLWLVCLGLSYPVVTFYIFIPLLVNDRKTAMCTGAPVTKRSIFLYYITMNCLFFLPILVLFFWFYYKIAFLIWRHRKPLNDDYHQQEVTDTCSSSKPVQDAYPTSALKSKKKNVQMKSKIRSFKVVVALVLAFITCRLPYWLQMIYQQLETVNKNVLWNVRFATISLHLFNCVLNPLLYTYLNITITVCRKVSRFVTHYCCCWFSNLEFEDFERGKHTAEGVVEVENNDEVKDKGRVQFINVAMPTVNRKEIY